MSRTSSAARSVRTLNKNNNHSFEISRQEGLGVIINEVRVRDWREKGMLHNECHVSPRSANMCSYTFYFVRDVRVEDEI